MNENKSSPRKSAASPGFPGIAPIEGESPAISQPDSVQTPEAPTALSRPQRQARLSSLRIPPILLEGDLPPAAAVSGTGRRYALGPGSPNQTLRAEGDLPDSYGTQELMLAARDPHWLYAHWDLTLEQQRRHNSRSADRHPILRIYTERVEGRPAAEIHVHPESRHWFVHVQRAGTKYIAELGLYSREGQWETISTSKTAATPAEAVSADTSVQLATVPTQLPMVKLLSLIHESVQGKLPLKTALEEWRAQGQPELPHSFEPPLPPRWSPALEPTPANAHKAERQFLPESSKLDEIIRAYLASELSSISAGRFGLPAWSAEAPGSISSAMAPGQPERGFRLDVNAELVVYGATDPTAALTIGGWPVQLRADGSFTCRFALPDGQYELAIIAVSADGAEGRAAELSFRRGTQYRGGTGSHPANPELATPPPANA